MRLQNTLEQQLGFARPAATDIRAKTASFLALFCVSFIMYTLSVGMKIRLRTQRRRRMRRQQRLQRHLHLQVNPNASDQPFFLSIRRATPSHLAVALLLLCLKTGYVIASAFEWSISPLRYRLSAGWFFGLGYAPVLAVLMLFNLCGWCDINEDRLVHDRKSFFEDDFEDDVDDDSSDLEPTMMSRMPSTPTSVDKSISKKGGMREAVLDLDSVTNDSQSNTLSRSIFTSLHGHDGADGARRPGDNGQEHRDLEMGFLASSSPRRAASSGSSNTAIAAGDDSDTTHTDNSTSNYESYDQPREGSRG